MPVGAAGADGRLRADAVRHLPGPAVYVRGDAPRRRGRGGVRAGLGLRGGGSGAFGPDHEGPAGFGAERGRDGREGSGGRDPPARAGRAAPGYAVLGAGRPGRAAEPGAPGLRNGRNSTFRVAGGPEATVRRLATVRGGVRIVCVVAHPAQPFHTGPDGNPRVRRPDL